MYVYGIILLLDQRSVYPPPHQPTDPLPPSKGYIGSRVRTAYAHDNGTVVLDVMERKVGDEPVSLVFVRPLKVGGCVVGLFVSCCLL